MQDQQFVLEDETVLWEESPSHWNQFGLYLLSALLIVAFGLGLIMMLVIYLNIRFTRYKLTSQRLIISTGIFNRKMESLELYRVKDIRYDARFFQRLVGIGTIFLVSSDRSTQGISLKGFRDSQQKFNQIRNQVETCRVRRGVKEFDQNDRMV
jgi:hypothetical protein